MMLPIRPEDYPDPNWCPDCGEMRGICRCPETPIPDWAIADEPEPEYCPYCHGSTLDLTDGTGGTCSHCFGGLVRG